MYIWQIIGTLSLAAVCGGGLAVLLRQPKSARTTISYHIATKRHYFIFMAILLSVGAMPFYGFLLFWLLPTYALPSATYWIVIAAYIAQLLVAWLPAKPGTLPGRIHAAGGIVVGTSMVACIWIVALFGQNLGTVSMVLSTITVALSSLTFVILIANLIKPTHWLLITEMLMIGSFALVLIALSWQL